MYIRTRPELHRAMNDGQKCAYCNKVITQPHVVVVGQSSRIFYHAGCAIQVARDILAVIAEQFPV
jgi:hypothetical protein